MLNKEIEHTHDNPVYSAGFIAGREFEQEQQAEREKKKPGAAMTVTVKATEMDVFKELAVITVNLAEYVQKNHPTREGKALLKKIDDFHEVMKQRTEESERKRESEGVTIQRL